MAKKPVKEALPLHEEFRQHIMSKGFKSTKHSPGIRERFDHPSGVIVSASYHRDNPTFGDKAMVMADLRHTTNTHKIWNAPPLANITAHGQTAKEYDKHVAKWLPKEKKKSGQDTCVLGYGKPGGHAGYGK